MRRFFVRALIPSPALVAGAVAFLSQLRSLGNADMLWHLAVGRQVFATRAIPDVNAFYYTHAAVRGTDYSWLSQLVLYSVMRCAGGTGLTVLNALVAGATFLMFYRMLQPACDNMLVNIGVLALAYGAISPYLDGRPAMFSILLFSALLLLVSRYLAGQRRWLWFALPLSALWANLHPGFMLAPIAILLLWISAPRARRSLAWGVLAVFGASFINPFGWRIYMLPVEVIGQMSLLGQLTEWRGLDGWDTIFFCGLLGLLLILLLKRRTGRFRELTLTAVLAGASLAIRRNLPLFAVAAVSAIGDNIRLDGVHWRGFVSRFSVRPRSVGGLLWPVIVPCAFLVLSAVKVADPFPLGMSRYPEAAVDYLERHRPEDRIFVREAWSGYLLWRMPEQKLFFDAKASFSEEAAEDLQQLVGPRSGWRVVADKYGIQTFLIERESPLSIVLSEAAGWTAGWRDSLAVVYHRVVDPQAARFSR